MIRSAIESVKSIVLESRTTYTGDAETDLSAWVDLSDAELVEFQIIPDTLATVITVDAYEGTDSSGAGEQVLTGKSMTIPADGDNKLHRFEIHHNELSDGYTHVLLKITSDTGNQDLNSVVANLYNFMNEPVTQDASVEAYLKGGSTTVVSV